jgi:hypothetical protein
MTGPGATRWVGGRLAAGLGVSLACVAAVVALAAPNLAGAFEIVGFGAAVSFDGSSSRQAGEHADLRFRLGFPLDPESQQLEASPRDLRVDLPPGFTADPPAVPTCSFEQLSDLSGAAACPRDTQIGVAAIEVAPGQRISAPLFNLERPPDSAGLFGFNAGVPVMIQAQVRPGDYGISALSARTSQAMTVVGVEIELWGEPSDPSHDAARGGASDLGPTAFLTNATSCPVDAVAFAVEADSWQQPGLFSRASVDSDFDGALFSLEGCELLAFSPAFAAQSGSRRAAAPTGFRLDLALPGGEVPGGLAGARTRNLTATLPPGFAISLPGVALVSTCSPEQIGLGSNDSPTCPSSSRIGTVRIDSPLVDRPLEGGVVLAKPYDNPFGSLLAVYLLVEGPGFYLKLPGRGELDPSNGQLTISFSDLPQLPFSDFRLDLFGGPEALLTAPSACGEYRTDAEISSWSSDAPFPRSSTTTISEGCAGGEFQPNLYGGSTNPVAGRASPFILRLTRSDPEQNIARFQATLPPGVSATLADVPHCPEPAAASGDCPAASRVGTAIVGLGAGEAPAYLPEAGKPPGAIYLAGPYRGAPFSLLISVPGQVGPFGLGAVVVRAAVNLDPRTAQIEIDSGPLPQILRGVPLNYRDIRLEIDRPGFIRNPTSCEPLAITATATSALGRPAHLSHHFQIVGCGALPFKPRLALRPSGALGRNGHPVLRAVLRVGPREAGIADAAFTLPPGELLDTDHIRALCARRLSPERCPHASRLGFARIWTPALAQPLRGPIYLRVPTDRYPEMLVDLRGDDQLSLVLHGRTESAAGGRLRVRFSGLPDLPLSKAILTLAGGRRGIFVNSEALCARPRRATVSLSTHSGKRRLLRPELDLRGSC